MNDKEVEFKGKIVRCTYNTDDYKVFAVEVDKSIHPEVKFGVYGTASIYGNIHDLGVGIVYTIKAIEERNKYGYGYKVVNIKRDKPNSKLDMQLFLSEILTPNQADILFEAYPDIVDRVIQNKLDDVDLNKTKGIKEATFNKIKDKIIDNFALIDLVSEFQGLLSLEMVKKLYDKYASVEKVRVEMKNNPYKSLCGLARVGFKTADSLLLDIDETNKKNIKKNKSPIIDFGFDLKTSEQRCLSCVMYLLEENESSGNTKMDIVELKHQCDKLVPACSNHFVEVLKNKNIYYSKDDRVAALKYTYDMEDYISRTIIQASKVNNKWNYDYKKYQNIGGFPLTDEQTNALKFVCEHNVSILNGSGGSGKSQTTTSVIKMLDDNKRSYLLLSPTGRAAKVLSEYANKDASTIHRGLGYMPPNEWSFNANNKVTCDIVIVDEVSMVDIFLFKRVIDAIDFTTTKLMLIGDNAQLPSVACGNLLHDLMHSKTIPTTTLTKIFRYGEGGLMTVATDTRNCKRFLPSELGQCTFFGNNKDYAFINLADNVLIKNVLGLYEKLLSQGEKVEDIQILTAYNKGDYGTVSINNHIQKIANKNYGDDKKCIKIGNTSYYLDDIVIQKVNNYKAQIYISDNWSNFNKKIQDENDDYDDLKTTFIANGEIGKIIEVNQHNVVIKFNNVDVMYDRNDLQGVRLGYSISIHSSQGGSIKIPILITPKSHTFMLNSNLLYVGMTRMKVKVFHLGSADAVNIAIKKKENYNRKTFMKQMLLKYHNDKSLPAYYYETPERLEYEKLPF